MNQSTTDRIDTLQFTRMAAKRSKPMLIALAIAHGLRVRWRASRGRIDSLVGSSHRGASLQRSIDYVDATFRDYVQYGNLTPDKIAGRHIVELGPGDNMSVALRFLAAGASRVTCLDRFETVRDREQERRIYLAVRERLPADQMRAFDASVDLSKGIQWNPDKLRCIYGVAAEKANTVLDAASVDLIISRAVLEEIYDTDELFRAMDEVLIPGGWMVHKIDLRDYGLFSAKGFHPLEFLTIPDALYRLMTYRSDQPNRRLIDYYRNKMAELGYAATIHKTAVVSSKYSPVPVEVVPHKVKLEMGVDYDSSTLEMIRAIRPRLAARFRSLPEEDLMVAGIFLTAQKRP
jgi:hypothetical protein